MPQPLFPAQVRPPQDGGSKGARPRKRHLRRRSDRLIRLIMLMAIMAGMVISAVIWQQSSTIAKQRALIQLIFQDSLELNKMKQRELQQKQQDKKRSTSSDAQPSGPYADGCIAHHGPCT